MRRSQIAGEGELKRAELEMPDTPITWPFLQSYTAYALALAASFYAAIRFFGNHFSKSAKDDLALWLLGAYDDTWSSQFCKLFDTVFGTKHLSWSCFRRSAVASFIAVIALWFLVDPLLGLLNYRTASGLDIREALLLGALINVIPDYISLLETRWLLYRFQNIRSFRGQAIVLVADAIFTGTIIWISITIFLFIFEQDSLSAVENACFI